jgi:hypothetical protein
MTASTSPFSSNKRDYQLTICPCCGDRFEGDFGDGCISCGATAVGEPLPRPEYELPSYGRSLVLSIAGVLMLLTFVVQTIIALVQRIPLWLGFWSFVNAAETAAWRLKWVGILWCILVLFVARPIFRSITLNPDRFCGLRAARRGMRASAAACLLVTGFIGISVPARLRNIEIAHNAAYEANIRRVDRAILEYGLKFKSKPSDLQDLLTSMPDPDGSLAAAIRELGPLGPGMYKPSGADLAALPSPNRRSLRGAVIKNASVESAPDDTLTPGLAFTNYELRLPGPDKIPGNEDDLVVRDGLITKASEAGPGVIGSTASSGAIKR